MISGSVTIQNNLMFINSTTKEILNGSWKILKANKKLLFLSIIPVFITVILAIFFINFLFYTFEAKRENLETILFLLILFFIIIFITISLFRGVLIYCIGKFIKDGNINIKEGFYATKKSFLEIIKWSLTDSIFKIGIGTLNRKGAGYEAIPLTFVGISWKLLTIFVIPLIVLENLSVKKAIIKSYQLFTQTWKIAAIFDFSLDLLFLIVGVSGVFILPTSIIFLDIIDHNFTANNAEVLLISIYSLFAIALLSIGLFVATIREIFIVVLYNYAVFNKIPKDYFNEEIVKKAFK